MASSNLADIIKNVKQPQFDNNMIKKLVEGLNSSFSHYYTYIQMQNEIETSGEFDIESEQELWKKKSPGYKQGEHFRHMGSREDIEYTFSRLYVNCNKSDLMELANMFTDKCNMRKIPIYFKYSTNESTRADQFVIYSNLDNLCYYIQILQEIGQENPQIVERCGKPPLLTGKINEWIGIGDEPRQKDTSYTEIRADIIESVLKKVIPQTMDEEGFYSYDTENIDYDIVRTELKKAFKDIGIDIDTFAFNSENLQLYMADVQTRQNYSEQRKQQIKDDKQRILEEKKAIIERNKLKEYYLAEQIPIQELKILKQMGFMSEIIGTMTDATSSRYALLTDLSEKTNTSDFLQTRFSLPPNTTVTNQFEIQFITPEGIVDISENKKQQLSSLILSDLTKYYTNFFKTEQANIDETLSRYCELVNLPTSENADIDLERTDLYTKLILLAKGKEFFKTIGIPEENLEVVCDRVQSFLQDLEQKREEKEKTEREERKSFIDRDYLQAVFQDTGITDPEELRKLYENQDEIKVSEEDLKAVLSTFSDTDNIGHSKIGIEDFKQVAESSIAEKSIAFRSLKLASQEPEKSDNIKSQGE